LFQKLRKFSKKLFASKYTDLLVILVVFLSILILAFEAIFASRITKEMHNVLLLIDDIIIVFFLIELSLRYFSCDSLKEFLCKYWLDILAVVPLFRVFRMSRIFRLFRLFRVLSFAILMGRHLSFLSSFLGKRWLEVILVGILLIFIIVFGTLGIRTVEIEPVYIINDKAMATLAEELPPDKMDSFKEILAREEFKGNKILETTLIKQLKIYKFSANEIDIVKKCLVDDLCTELDEAFWTALFTLATGEYADTFPDTIMGKIIVLIIMFSGMSVFAILVGASTAVMMDMFKEGFLMKKASFDILEGHIIICGWQEKTIQIIKELHLSTEYARRNIVLISDREDFASMDLKRLGIDTSFVYLIEGDFTDPSILKKANIDTAKIALILPDRSGKRSARDMDARTLLTALTIEKLNSSVYSCVELLDPEYESHMKIGKVDQVIVGGYYSGLIAAHSAINENLIPFIKSIFPSDSEYELLSIPITLDLIGKDFGFVVDTIRKRNGSLPLAIKTAEGAFLLNPQNYFLKDGDRVVGIVRHRSCKTGYLEKTFKTVILSRNRN